MPDIRLSHTTTDKPLDADMITEALLRFGFRFNPFQHLEASQDPHLGDYLVGHEFFQAAWTEAPAVIFAPSGGGKTAMCLYTMRACWVGPAAYRPLPVRYTPSELVRNTQTAQNNPMVGLLHAVARSVLVALAYQPERFLLLDRSELSTLTYLLQRWLPGSLAYYLHLLQESNAPATLGQLLLDLAAMPAERSTRACLPNLCSRLTEIISNVANATGTGEITAAQAFREFVHLLLGPAGYRSIFILIDGIDAEPLEAPSAALTPLSPWMLRRMGWLLQQTPAWAAERVFVKGFLPAQAELQLTESLSALTPLLQRASLTWTPPLLAEMVRHRVYVATEGDFGSLDAISGSGLRDIETALARLAPSALPREILFLVRRVLYAYAQRVKGSSGSLEAQDIEAAERWYRQRLALATHTIALN